MRKWLALLAGALFAGAALAADITEAQARTVAAYFVGKDTIGMRILPNRTVDTVTKRGGLWLVTLKPSGHIFVSVNRSAEPIPSFSENDFTEPEAGSPQAAFLALAETNSINATGTKYETRWKTLLGQKVLRLTTSSTTEYVNIDPLVKSTWTQNYPYNDLMPIVNSKSTLVGCVATAYSQILRYWEWPEVLDEDFITEHTVDSTWGHKWRLKAGTIFDWGDMPLSDGYDYVSRLKLGRGAMFAGMLARMKYNTEASGAQTEQPGQNRWYTAPRVFDTANSELTEREKAMKQSLLNGCPFMVSVNYGTTGHAVVGDGWQESASGKYVHMNYGWGSADNTYYTTSSALGVYLDAKPRPMVMNKPLAASSTLPVKVEWSFPKYGYTNTHTGFDVSYAEVEDTIADWTDGMDSQTGEIDGDLITLETVDSSGHGPVLRIGTQADEATYTWPTMVATKDTVFSYDIHSKEALNMLVEMQVLDPSVGWIALATPEISEKSEIEWTNHSINLGHYAGKGIAIRVKASRTGSTYTKDETARLLGVQFDNITLTKVRQPKAAVAGRETAGKDARYLNVSGSLASGKTYLFQVTPTFNDGTEGIPGYKASCKIVDTAVEKPTITSVTSVRSGAPTVQNNMYRECYFGLNQFGVYGSEATTKLEAHLSNLVVVDQGVPFWDEAFNEWATGKGLRSLDGVVSVDTKSNGKFLVKVDASQLTSYLNGVGMILTLIARNDQGDAAQKDFYLEFTKTGTEQELAVADLPENGGTVTPDEPDPVYYYVYFDSMGGNTIASKYLKEGDKLGTLTEPTKDGYTFAGWFTASTGGTQITANTTVSKTITYYAQWNKVEDSDPDPEEDPDEPSGGDDPVIDPTDGNANDFTEGGVNYRFCNGVDKSSGYKDVSRVGYYAYQAPGAYNLVLWWADAYKTAQGSYPTGYAEPSISSFPNDGTITTFPDLAVKIFKESLLTALPTDAERAAYFPTVAYTSAEWCGSTLGDAAVKAAGRRIFAMLNNGPIGIMIPTSSTRSYGGVIWGCKYDSDDDGNYATVIYFTSTKSNESNGNNLENATLANVTVSGVGTMPGFKGFNSNGGVIKTYYPIVGPATASGGEDEPDDPVVTPTMFTVTFDANGGTSRTSTLEVEEGKTIAELPTAEWTNYTFDGWFDINGNELTISTKITADITYTARWTAVTPDEPDEPDQPDDPVTPDDPVVIDDDPIGVAINDKDPGNNYTASYQYEMYDNYYTARKRAIQQGKQLFILSGASWCSNCAFVKSYLATLGAAFTDKFVVYYSNHDDDVSSPYFHGGLPQYGAADPRTTDAFTGTLDGTTRTWSSVWTTTGCGIYKQDRGGYASDRVDTVVAAGQAKAAYSYPTNLVVRGLTTLATGYAGQYELYAQFADGVEMPVDYGVEWSVVSGNGSLAKANVDGREVTALTITSGDVILGAKSTFYFTGTKTITVKSTDLSNVESVAINTTSVNLEDDATPLIDAVATMKDGSKIAVVGFGEWSATFKSRIARKDADLEEDNVTPEITFDGNSRLTYAKTNGKLEVCDQKIDVTLTVNGKSATKEVTVWGPTKVAPSKWKMISGSRQTALGVVRLQCTELKYNYGGEIYTTTDTYFASYKTVIKYGSSTTESYLRGLTAYSPSSKDETCYVGLAATKVNGKFTGYTPSDPIASALATNYTNVATGSAITDIDKGDVPSGFFKAFFPSASSNDYATLAETDSDGDGFLNWEEYVLGTDPTNKGDAFTLMQGYQHLTAPAADGETMQYKVMYAQRARRIYYIEAKKDWSDDWTSVATVSLANMAEDDVTSFTGLNASYADAAKFFRVRASLYEHYFLDPTTAPKIETAMLVANRGAVIDLTSEALPLNLSSFDTDATDAGTVYVKVPAGTKAGDVLITAPAAAATSMAALAPQGLDDGLKFVVEATDNGRLALKVASDAPVVTTFTVTFNSDGGTEFDPMAIEDGQVIASIPQPTKQGYVFGGWYDGETMLTAETKITSDVTYTAKWEIDNNIDVPEGTVYTIGAAAFGEKIFSGAGTIKMAQTSTSGKANLKDLLAAANFADGFTGTIELGAGRYVYSADCVPSNVKISVIDGAQLFVSDGVTMANAVTIAGNGWGGEANYAVSKAALRLGDNAAISGMLTVANDAKIGVHDGNSGSLNGVVSGSGTLTKWAGGTLLLSKATSSNFTGRFIVGQGTVKANTGSVNFFGCGSDAKAIIVEKGATFDMNGKHSADLTICLNGGMLSNTASGIDSKKKTIRKIILTDDSTIAGSQNYGLIASNYAESFLDLQGHTLTFAMNAGKDFWMPNTTATNGTIVVQSGRFYPWHAGSSKTSRYYCTLRLEGGEFKVQGDSTVDTLVLAGGAITDSYALTIAKELIVEKTTTISRAITLGGAAKVNLPTNVTLTVNAVIDAAKFVLPDGYELEAKNTGSTYAYSAIATAPAIEGGKGTVVVDDEKIVVTPNEGVTEVVISNPGERKVEIPPSVDRIGGVTDSSKIVIRHTFGDNKSVDLTAIMKFTPTDTGVTIALDESAKGKTVNVNGEDIAVTPELSDSGDSGAEQPFGMTDESVAIGIKTIPGLKYQVLKGGSPKGPFNPVGEAQTAESARTTLEIQRGEDPSAFYTISVSK